VAAQSPSFQFFARRSSTVFTAFAASLPILVITARRLSTKARALPTSSPAELTERVPDEKKTSGVAPASIEAARLPDEPNLKVTSHPDSLRKSSVISVNAEDRELAANTWRVQLSAESLESPPHPVRDIATTATTQAGSSLIFLMVVKM
jgi:hypothetical protein